METRVLVVSLGRVVADHVRVDATEAYAVVQQLWQRIQASLGDDDAMMVVPALNAMGITAFGDFQLRRAACTGQRRGRAPHQLAQGLGGLLLRLLASADPGLDNAPRACVDAARRTSSTGPRPQSARPIATPDELLTALDAFRPRDPSAALAGLYARWIRTTDSSHPAPWLDNLETPPALAPSPGNEREPTAAVGSRPSASQRTLAVLVALACLVLSGVLGWQWGSGQLRSAAGDHTFADSAVAPSRTTASAGPVAAPEPSPTEIEVAPSPEPLPSPTTPLRARRLLHADRTGKPPYSPSFDPHSNTIVFHAGRQQTSLLQASLTSEGVVGAISTVREDGLRSYHAQVSPDGEGLAYDSDVDGTRGVYIANRDGSSPKRVSGTGYASVPTWSPDGQYVAFARAEPGRPRVWNVWTVHLPTGTLRRRTAHRVGQAWGASWFPDGRRIAYSLEDRLIVRDLDRGVSRVYPTPVAGRLVRTPAVSPDGQRIVFQVYRDGAWVLDLRTGSSRRLLADVSAEEFAWSPDGQRVAYHSVRGGEWGIWMLDLTLAP